eukprot:6207031-Pleurochrysis_carterae.AAC.5
MGQSALVSVQTQFVTQVRDLSQSEWGDAGIIILSERCARCDGSELNGGERDHLSGEAEARAGCENSGSTGEESRE